MESTNYNAAELAQTCAAALQTSTVPDDSNPNSVGGSHSQQQDIASIVGGLAGAAVLLCIVIVMAVWFRRKRVKRQLASKTDGMHSINNGDFETVNMLPSSSMPPPAAHVPTLDINVPVSASPTLDINAPVSASFNGFLVANQASRQSQEIEQLPRDPYQMRHENAKSQPITDLEAAIPEHEAFVSQKSATAVNDKIMLDLPSKLPSKMQTCVPSQTL
ncbi:hypothetical protein HDU80_011550, partial [Chytriomyces hyalinus]